MGERDEDEYVLEEGEFVAGEGIGKEEEGEGEEGEGEEEEEEGVEEEEEEEEEEGEEEEEKEEEEEEEDEEEDPMEEDGSWQREFLKSRPVRSDFKYFFWAVYVTTGLAYLHVETSGNGVYARIGEILFAAHVTEKYLIVELWVVIKGKLTKCLLKGDKLMPMKMPIQNKKLLALNKTGYMLFMEGLSEFLRANLDEKLLPLKYAEEAEKSQTPTTTTTTVTKGGSRARSQRPKDVISPQTIVRSSDSLERGSSIKTIPGKIRGKKIVTPGPPRSEGQGEGKGREEELQVPQGFVPNERTEDLTKTWEELKSLKEKKLSHESFYLPMKCLKRPPLVNGKRPMEVREMDEDHVKSIMDSMLKQPTGDHLPFVGLIDPAQAGRKEDVTLTKLRAGDYDIFVLGGGHSREARERLARMKPDNEEYQYNVCYIYVGLTIDEARQVAHRHNLAAGYHRDLSFIEKLRCWRQCAFKPQEIWELMCKIMSMWQKGEVKGRKLTPAVRSFLKADQDLETSESEGAKKSQRGKRLDRAAAKEQEMPLLYPRVQLQGNKVPKVAEDMPAQHWIAMGSMAPKNAVPILLEVIARQISLKEMEKKFQLVKQIAYARKAFTVGVGAADFKDAEKEYPLHTKKEILKKFVGGIRRGQTSIPALDGHIKWAIEWKNKERRLQAKNAIHTFRTKPLVERFVEWTEVIHDNDSTEVKIINGDVRLLSKLQTEKLPISLAIFDFPYGFAHEGHTSDNEPFPESDVVEVLHNLKDVFSAPLWTVAGFCSVDMLPSIRSTFWEACNAGQELLTWCKPNVMNPGGPRLVSATEFCVLGYYSESGQREMAHYNFDPTDMRHNFQLFNAMTQKYQHPGGGVLCPYQKSYTLYSWLVNKFSPAGACVLDGFSGSGTGAIACVKANRNCLVVEINTKCAKGIATRLLTHIGGTLACETPKRKEKVAQGSTTSNVSGDTKSVGNELVPDENTGTAAGVTDIAEAVVVGPSGASLPTAEAAAGPRCGANCYRC
ncbi:hypothetical protein CBR_g57390 [Chara braunii]|uniref:DNA methylase N-4/N-6 domain-containing protein n=1 Tax=Chara braunii TaxID=69332 RepID=A0A388MEC1_CHABU|nr:hypothetical protein CBR_g57390 [Chara braunii]|eukprot:GBG92839.1 hypothetical protein CBR_g57390 [Chara braunii]